MLKQLTRLPYARVLVLIASCWLAPTTGCSTSSSRSPAGCVKDTDCKGARICVFGACVDPAGQPDLASIDSGARDLTALLVDGSGVDRSAPPVDLAVAVDSFAAPDLSATPSASDCFMGWRSLGGACPAPIVTASYYTGSQCAGTAGWVFEGDYFQFDQPDPYQPILSWGPTDHGSSAYGGRNLWNKLTASYACITICVGCGSTIIGADLWLTNPDGKSSNHVTGGSRP